MLENKFEKMTDVELVEFLKEYADERGGEISDLTREASNRIAALDAGAKEYKEILEDDCK